MSASGKSTSSPPAGAGVSEPADFDWVALRADMGTAHYGGESSRDKFIRKFNDNPFVPIGCLATVTALSVGLWSFRKGNQQLSQKMMRARIAAQGFTVIALITGVVYTAREAMTKQN